MKPEQYKHIDDNEILQRFYIDRNNEWLGIVLQRYTMMLLGVCMKYLKNEEEARDAVQQIFLKSIDEIQKYKITYFKSWIYMVAKNYCLMQLRDKTKYNNPIDERLMAVSEENEGIATHIEKDRQLNNMSNALEQLNKEQQQCVTLFYLEKKSYQEIADTTGYSLLQVKSHIQNGKRNLKILMDKMTNE